MNGYALSPMQAGLVADHAVSPDSGVDVVQVEVELNQSIKNVAAFRHAWQDVTRRHDALRTGFRWRADGTLEQWVDDSVELPWSELADPQAITGSLVEDRARGFSLASPPLVRCTLLGDRRLVFTFHHAVLDGRSLHLLFGEVFARYAEREGGRPAPVSPQPVPYRAFIDWLAARDDAGDESFWRGELQGYHEPTILSEWGMGDARGAHAEHDLLLPEAFSDQLRALAAAHELTLNTLFQAAWALLLRSCTGQQDVAFGATRSVRRGTFPMVDDVLGLFLNTLPVRARVDGDRTTLQLLRDLRRQALGVRDHQHAPLMRVQQWAQTPPGQSLFDTILVYENRALRLPGCTIRLHRRPNYPMAISVFAEPAVLVKLVHDSSRFTADQVRALADRLQRILHSMVDDPDRRIADLPLLSDDERHQALQRWNTTAVDYPLTPVHEQVAAHAARRPAARAVADLSYAQVNRWANRLAHTLRCGRGDIVAIRLPRCTELVVAQLAVLKTGAAYLPLDPAHPQSRIDALVRDAGAQTVIDESWMSQAHGPDHDPDVQVSPDDPAYVIYTSGSTGRPKGVVIPHRGLSNLAAWVADTHRLTPADRMTLVANPAFDATVLEVWPCLAAGASLHLPDEDTLLTPTALARWLSTQQISVAFLPTGLAELVLDQPWPESLALRALAVGGDRLHRPTRADLPFRLYNLYGPTECSVVATYDPVDPQGPALPPIGRPIANIKAYVLDRDRSPVPIGTPGELYLAGVGLAHGYLGSPELTAERFPMDERLGTRLYRTGDLCRQRPDGRLEFLGRVDRQVKVRGFRVEPGEIEAALREHAAVVRAAVLSVRAGVLVGYVVASGVTGDELRAHLRQRLPAHLVPTVISVVSEIPLTANGKVDLAALPTSTGRPPADSVQSRIARIWAEVLQTPTPGADDDFFALGGHSLHAVAASLRLTREFQVEVPARLFFESPILADFGEEVSRLRRSARVVAPIRRLRRDQS